MKILHTADWHLGHRLHEQSQIEEQKLFLNWIENYITTQKIDVLLISGDVFDTGSPSNQSKKMYFDFLVKINQSHCSHIIITGGNHDSPEMLNAPKELLNALSIKVVGKAPENVADEVFELSVNNEKTIIGAVPYLRDQDIRRAVAGENFDELVNRYKTALINHYNLVAEYCKSINKDNVPVIAMGHLFATGGKVSESEQNIYVGNLGHIKADEFPTVFDYIALGHLHRPQIVGDNPKIRYSGSPHILSFSELNYDKKIIVIDTNHQKVLSIDEVKIPRFREVYQLNGTINECINQFENVISNTYQLTPWVEIVLDELLESTKSIKELKPEEVFKLKCKEEQIDLKEQSEIWDAFNEILQQVKEQ